MSKTFTTLKTFSLGLILFTSFSVSAFAASFNDNLGGGFGSAIKKSITQPDNKILVGGYFHSFNGNVRNGIVRLNTDGTEDKNFYSNIGNSSNNLAFIINMSLQKDNKILIAAAFNLTNINYNPNKKLIRLNNDGTEDVAFYQNLGAGFNNMVFNAIEDSSNKIVVTGIFTSFNGKARNGIVRLNADGTEDTAFATNFVPTANSWIYSTTLQQDGKILVGGLFANLNYSNPTGLVRLNVDGTEDITFRSNLGTSFNKTVNNIFVLGDSKILVGGGFSTFNGKARNGIVRLNADGTEDMAFYENLGLGFNNIETKFNIYVQPNNQILVSGLFTTFNGENRNGIVRLNSDGTEDINFYKKISQDFYSAISSVEYSSNNKILISFMDKNYVGHLIRLNSDGTEDLSGGRTSPVVPPRKGPKAVPVR